MMAAHRTLVEAPRPTGMFTCDNLAGLVYASDMRVNYGVAQPISDANPTGSRVSPTGLVLSWDGHTTRNGKAKNFADPSGNTDGTLSGGVTAGGATGIRGAATALDGVDDLIAIPDSPAWQAAQANKLVSVSAWVKVTGDAAGNWFIFNKEFFIQFWRYQGGLKFQTHLDGGFVGANLAWTPNLNQWYHIVGTYDGATHRLYIDGALVASLAVTGAAKGTYRSGAIGNYYAGGESYSLAGVVADIIVEARAWSDTEVRQLYEDTYGWVENKANPHCKDISDQYPLGTDRVSSEGLVLSLDMETLTPDGKLKDFSGQGNHATITGAKYQRGAIKNGAYLFTTGTHVLTTGYTADNDKLTYAFWFKPTNLSGDYDLIGKTNGDRVKLQLTTGRLRFIGSTTVASTNGLGVNAASFCIVKVDGNNVTFKVNDVANGSGTVTSRLTSANPLSVGGVTSAAAIGLYGPAMVFNRITTDAEDTKLFIDGQKMLGLVQGGATSVPGQVGSAVDLNGTSQYVEVQDCPVLNPAQVTVGAWMMQDSYTDGYPHYISKQSAGNIGYKLFGVNSGSAAGYFGNGTANAQPTVAGMALNKWQLLAAVFDGTSGKASVNGALGSGQALAGPMAASSSPLMIGCNAVMGQLIDGRIAFPFIFNRALSASEISKLYLSGKMARW